MANKSELPNWKEGVDLTETEKAEVERQQEIAAAEAAKLLLPEELSAIAKEEAEAVAAEADDAVVAFHEGTTLLGQSIESAEVKDLESVAAIDSTAAAAREELDVELQGFREELRRRLDTVDEVRKVYEQYTPANLQEQLGGEERELDRLLKKSEKAGGIENLTAAEREAVEEATTEIRVIKSVLQEKESRGEAAEPVKAESYVIVDESEGESAQETESGADKEFVDRRTAKIAEEAFQEGRLPPFVAGKELDPGYVSDGELPANLFAVERFSEASARKKKMENEGKQLTKQESDDFEALLQQAAQAATPESQRTFKEYYENNIQ